MKYYLSEYAIIPFNKILYVYRNTLRPCITVYFPLNDHEGEDSYLTLDGDDAEALWNSYIEWLKGRS